MFWYGIAIFVLINYLVNALDRPVMNTTGRKKLDTVRAKQCSDEQRVLVRIFKGQTPPHKHPRGFEISEKECEIEREIALCKILADVWGWHKPTKQGFLDRIEALDKRRYKGKFKSSVKNGNVIEWGV